MAPADATTAVGLAARLGAYCRVEQQLFAVLGSWVVEVPEPDVKLALAEHADHAAWRARRWYELLPTAPPGADALVMVPPEADAAVEAAAALGEGADRTLEKLAVAGRVLLPRLAAALHAHLDWTSPLTEPAVGRVLAVCAADVDADWAAHERLVQALAVDEAGLDRVAAAQRTAERALVAAGGLIGPGSVGARGGGGAP
jgi:hypothetical protein